MHAVNHSLVPRSSSIAVASFVVAVALFRLLLIWLSSGHRLLCKQRFGWRWQLPCRMRTTQNRDSCDGKAKYDSDRVAPTDLLRELAVHPCCSNGCVTTILGLPSHIDDLCGCFRVDANFAGFCAPATVGTDSTDSQRQARVLDIGNGARTAYGKFRPRPDDSNTWRLKKTRVDPVHWSGISSITAAAWRTTRGTGMQLTTPASQMGR